MTRPSCQPDDPMVVCEQRKTAQRNGEFFFDSTPPHIGWKFVGESTGGGYRVPPRFTWTFCPFCGAELPDAATILRNLYRESGDGPE